MSKEMVVPEYIPGADDQRLPTQTDRDRFGPADPFLVQRTTVTYTPPRRHYYEGRSDGEAYVTRVELSPMSYREDGPEVQLTLRFSDSSAAMRFCEAAVSMMHEGRAWRVPG